MVIRDGSRYHHAMPTRPRHRLLGLSPSFTGARGLSMWNPPDGPITTVTLSHGERDLRTGAGVSVVSAAPSAFRTRGGVAEPDLDDVVHTALVALPGLTGEDLDSAVAALEDEQDDPDPHGPALWSTVPIPVDGVPRPFRIHRPIHRDPGRGGEGLWVAVAALPDVAVGLVASATDPARVELVTLDPDLPDYETAPVLHPRVGDLADTRARLLVEGVEPVLMRYWARDALAAGADTPSLHLAATTDLREPAALRRSFDSALDELGAPRLDGTAARWQYVRYAARSAVEGDLQATEAARRIASHAAGGLGFPARLQPFVDAVRDTVHPGRDPEEVEAACLRLARNLLATT